MCYYFIIHLPNFLFALIKQMIRSSNSELCKKTSCSAMLQDGPIDHDSRKVPMKKFSFNKYVNFLTCYLYWNLTPIFFKNCNEFGYILPNSCFTEQLAMITSEYTNKCDTKYCSVCHTKYKHKKMKRQESEKKKKIWRKSKRKRVCYFNICIILLAFLL